MSSEQLGNLISASKPYHVFFRRRKLNSFLLTSLAAFVLMCLIWTFTVRGFSSHANIVVSCNQETDPEHVIQRLVSDEMSDESLSQHIMIASEKAGIENEDVLNRNFDAVRQAFDFQIRKRRGISEYELSTNFLGNGSEGEQLLLRSVIKSLVQKIETETVIDEHMELVDQQYDKIQRNIESFAANRQTQLEETQQLVQHLDTDLSFVHQQVQQLRSLPPMESDSGAASNDFKPDTITHSQQTENQPPQSIETRVKIAGGTIQDTGFLRVENQYSQPQEQQTATAEETTFGENRNSASGRSSMMNVSHVRNSAVNEALDSIVALDTDSIRTQINEINHSIRSDAIQQREDVSTLRILSANVSDVSYNIRSVSSVQNIPSGGVPTNAHLFLLGLIAVAVGSVVAMYFRPELMDRGFDSTENAESSLGVPVIAEINCFAERADDSNKLSVGISNRIVQWSEIALFTVALLLIFICFWYPHIREAFFENPFHGLTEVVWLFFGK